MERKDLKVAILKRVQEIQGETGGQFVRFPEDLTFDGVDQGLVYELCSQMYDSGYLNGSKWIHREMRLRITPKGAEILDGPLVQSPEIYLTQHIDDHSIHASGSANVQAVTGNTQGNASVSRSEGSLLAKVIGWFKSLVTGA